MRFWDASAIVPLLIEDSQSPRLNTLAASDPGMSVWWASRVESISAVLRLRREGRLDDKAVAVAFDYLEQLAGHWNEVEPSDAVREASIRFLRVHPLRAADALQLAAAYLAAEQRLGSFEFVTLDRRLASAARKEGFLVLDVGLGS